MAGCASGGYKCEIVEMGRIVIKDLLRSCASPAVSSVYKLSSSDIGLSCGLLGFVV
jgi:hypothetical protein